MKNVMFIHIPKTAGSSIEKSLKLMRTRFPGRFKKRFKNSGHHSFGHLDVRKRLRNGAISKEFYESAFKFCFCRNPYDRAVSHYFYVIDKHPDKFSPKISFIDFTRTLGDYGRMFTTQKSYTDGIEFDFIGRFENLKEDFEKVKEIIGVDGELIKMNTTKHMHYSKHYNAESTDNIAKFYQEDFERFGYGYML